MHQPELGKRIAELRKSKGFTQEELVEKCNLSVRTLQRIESGEVFPRTYTVKLILEALDYSIDSSFEKALGLDQGLTSKWLEQFYISFIDLFNLKRNTMKKITILSIIFSAIVLGVFAINTNLIAQNNTDPQIQEDTEIESAKKRSMTFSNFSCHGCFTMDKLMIGRDVSFKLAGVKVENLKIIAINEDTREFKSSFVSGIFLEGKVEVDYSKDMLYEGKLEYSADKVKKSDSEIHLKGNAKIIDRNKKDDVEDDESIEAAEIIISLN